MNGVSLHWFGKVFSGIGHRRYRRRLRRSLELGLVVMVLTVVLSVAAGLAFRSRFRGSSVLFYTAIASLIMPSIIISLGIALEFRLLDDMIKHCADAWNIEWIQDSCTTAMGIFTSGLGAHLTWTLPFGLLIMFAIFNRFDRRSKKPRATSARRRGRPSGTSCCRSSCRRWSASACSALRCPGTSLRVRARPWAPVNTLPLELQGLTTTVTNAGDLRAGHGDQRGLLPGHRLGA